MTTDNDITPTTQSIRDQFDAAHEANEKAWGRAILYMLNDADTVIVHTSNMHFRDYHIESINPYAIVLKKLTTQLGSNKSFLIDRRIVMREHIQAIEINGATI